jgi:hypothetical protein
MTGEHNSHKGFTILFALLIVSLLLGTALSISNLTEKRLVLSSIGKQSQISFYAADTGVECARYWDTQANAFNTTQTTITCGDQDFEVGGPVEDGQVFKTSSFTLLITPPAGSALNYTYCAKVEVSKDLTTDEIKILSHGYNTPCDAKSARKVERAIEVIY